MAVLEKRANLLLQNQDAYLKAAGGVKLDEPAIDLALLLVLPALIVIRALIQVSVTLAKLV